MSNIIRWDLKDCLIAVALVSVPVPALAQPPGAPAQAEPEAEPPASEESANEPAAVRAVRALDMRRIETDRAYAEEMILHLQSLAQLAAIDERARLELDALRMYALVTAQRPREARALLDDLLARRPDQASAYALPWFAALRLDDHERAVVVVETASRTLRSSEWAAMRGLLDKQLVWMVMREFGGEAGRPNRARFAEALFRIGWPGLDDPESSDSLRITMLDERLARSDAAGAADLAAGIVTPRNVLSLILMRRYDSVIGSQDRVALLQRTIAAHDRRTAEALESAPADLWKVLERAQFLRGQAREREAYDLLEPFTRDVPATVASGEAGMWVINEAAYALLALGRNDEAVAMTGALAALPIEGNSALIGPSINHSVVLWSAGRNEEAFAHAVRLDRDLAQHANAFGRMWMLASAVCALESLGRTSETEPWMRRLRDGRDDNPAALTRAYLCLNDLDAAEALLVRRLGGDDPETLVQALQDHQLGGELPESRSPVFQRLIALRDRPAVRAALDRVGHLLTLPLSRTYWGGA